MSLPLTSIRAFAAAGRHLSFTAAALELNVTQGAISQQVARLEEYLGYALFFRSGRQLVFTPEGRSYYAAISASIDQIVMATDIRRRPAGRQRLGITTLNSFAAQWLMPRLPTFQAQHPSISLRLETSPKPIDLRAAGFDAAIRNGRGPWPGCTSERLFGEECFPVAHPSMAAKLELERGPRALAGIRLIYDTDEEHDWQTWFEAAGMPRARYMLGDGFSDSLVMIGALLAGSEAVALVRSGLVERELVDGRLVRLFDVSIPAWGSYHLVYPKAPTMSPALKAFRDWLIGQVPPAPTSAGAP